MCIALLASGVYAQTTPPQSASALAIPQPGDNLILVASSMPDSLLYLRAGQVLTESGFTISKANSDQRSIQAAIRPIDKAPQFPYLVVSVGKGVARITGFMELATSAQARQPATPTPIANEGTKGSVMHAGFDAMSDYAQRLANSINGTIKYVKQP